MRFFAGFLIVFGVIIIIFPAIIAYLLGVFFILLGANLFAVAFAAKKGGGDRPGGFRV